MELTAIREWKVLDDQHFQLVWSDGKQQRINLPELQSQCPCAACQGKQVPLDPKVRAKKVVKVGNFALKVSFTQGCSAGIYSYDQLRSLA